MKAILTRFSSIGPIKSVRAFIDEPSGKSIKLPWVPAFGAYENHAYAMTELLRKLAWSTDRNMLKGRWISGEIRGGYAWVFVPDKL
jgi:hypothetical protein